jgi:hypothetical protein
MWRHSWRAFIVRYLAETKKDFKARVLPLNRQYRRMNQKIFWDANKDLQIAFLSDDILVSLVHGNTTSDLTCHIPIYWLAIR